MWFLLFWYHLEYADDVNLLALSPLGLQRLIDCASEFCDRVGLSINPDKTFVMVFATVAPFDFLGVVVASLCGASTPPGTWASL